MTTPMQYDVLRECYSDTMAMFSRLKHKYNIPEDSCREDEEKYLAIWLREVKSVELEQIDYKKVLEKLQAISKPWHDFNKKLYEESKGVAKAVNA